MSKKNFIKGMDTLITPAVHPKEVSDTETRAVARTEKEKTVLLRMPVSLKIKMGHYCVENQMSQREFLINAIEKFLKENEHADGEE